MLPPVGMRHQITELLSHIQLATVLTAAEEMTAGSQNGGRPEAVGLNLFLTEDHQEVG